MDKKDKIFEISLVRSLRKHGIILPVDDEDFVYFDKEFLKDDLLPLPLDLKNINDNIYNHIEIRTALSNEIDIVSTENMSRAAREGQSIPKEVLDKMKIDRLNSEKDVK